MALTHPPATQATVGPVAKLRRRGFIGRYWRGEVPLGRAYWLVYVLLSVVVTQTVSTLQQRILLGTSYDPKLLFVVIGGGIAASLPVALWQFVGLWRSARARRRERHAIGRRAVWSRLVQANIVVGGLALAAGLAFSSAPALRELYRMAYLGDPGIPNYGFRTMRGGTEAEIVGGFKYGLTRDFTALLRQNPGLRVVHLDSVGGRIGEARHLYRAIKAAGLDTYVANGCYSACTMAFAAGAHRWLGPKAALGFPAPAFPGLMGAGSKMSDYEASVFGAAGFAPAFVARAIRVIPPALWKPSRQELADAHVVTDFADADRFADSGSGLDFSQATWDAKIEKVLPALVTLSSTRPDAFRAISSASVKAYREGASAQAVGAMIGAGFKTQFSQMLLQADDATLIDYAHLAVDEYALLGAKNPDDCYLYAKGLSGGRDITGELGPVLQARDAAMQMLVVRPQAPRAATSAADARAAQARYLKVLAATVTKAELDAVIHPQSTRGSHAAFCRGLVTMLRTAAAMEPHRAGLVLLKLFGGK